MSDQQATLEFEGSIDITIGPDPRLVRPVRLAMGGLASLAGFDVETIEDLRIAVNELVATLIERGDGTDLTLSLTVGTDGSMRIDGSTGLSADAEIPDAGGSDADGSGAEDGEDGERYALSDRILSVVADDHGFADGDGRIHGWVIRGRDDWEGDAGAVIDDTGDGAT